MGKSFIPHRQCTVSSGDCFHDGKCLRQCREQEKKDMPEAIRNLEHRVKMLELAMHQRKTTQ
jgi:hypothetical protein